MSEKRPRGFGHQVPRSADGPESLNVMNEGGVATRDLIWRTCEPLSTTLIRCTLQAALAASRDFQSQLNPTALRRWSFRGALAMFSLILSISTL